MNDRLIQVLSCRTRAELLFHELTKSLAEKSSHQLHCAIRAVNVALASFIAQPIGSRFNVC